MADFGDRLRRLRKEKGLTIRKLSELSGVAHSYLSQVETGKRGIPKVDTLEKIASGLNIPSVDLLMLAGYLPIEKVGYADDKDEFIKGESERESHLFTERKIETRALPDAHDLDYLLSSKHEIYFKNTLLNNLEKSKIKKLIEIILEY
ncbi:helix-turn-helix domain-containing protein [Neobacillus sp. NRS-1170]|uniref:helix-turn-helix domain-containing protein n=1 Tax=Neobacillus sp. NRS-1170 TaxID=3233898 RepID=UPI003D29685A